MMIARAVFVSVGLLLVTMPARAQTPSPIPARAITLDEAVALAREHNHVVRLAALEVTEREQAKEAARSAYFPSVRNDSAVVRVSDTQLVELPAGSLGQIGGTLIPSQRLIINQGGLTFSSSSTGAVQPLTQLLKIRAANDVARAELQASRDKARGVDNDVTLRTHQMFYRILVAEARRSAVVARRDASTELQGERVQQVKYGSALDVDLIESRAQSLQATQELLTIDLQVSDLRLQFNDLIGMPLDTKLTLVPTAAAVRESCERDECVKIALESHPEIAEARAVVDKADSALRLARYEFVPDVEAFARYTFHSQSAFFASRFATVGVHLSYDLFDGGKRRATIRERQAQLARAHENLARLRDEVEVRVQTAYNKLDRTRQMVAVSQELVTLREESRRVTTEQLTRGAALRSTVGATLAQELEAKALLLQSRLDYVQAVAEMDDAIGRNPR